jgi:hypothetical protein
VYEVAIQFDTPKRQVKLLLRVPRELYDRLVLGQVTPIRYAGADHRIVLLSDEEAGKRAATEASAG